MGYLLLDRDSGDIVSMLKETGNSMHPSSWATYRHAHLQSEKIQKQPTRPQLRQVQYKPLDKPALMNVMNQRYQLPHDDISTLFAVKAPK